LLDDFVAAGGQAMELSYPQLYPKEAQRMAKQARQRGLWASQGSDFHSPSQSWTELGKMPPQPPEVVTVWQAQPERFAALNEITPNTSIPNTNTPSTNAGINTSLSEPVVMAQDAQI
jgi:hypothetical protein